MNRALAVYNEAILPSFWKTAPRLALLSFALVLLLFFLLIFGRARTFVFLVVPGLEQVEINSLGASGGTIFLARDKYLVNLLSLFSLLDHLAQDFFQHSIFRALFDDAMLRVQLARAKIDRLSVHSRGRVAHFR